RQPAAPGGRSIRFGQRCVSGKRTDSDQARRVPLIASEYARSSTPRDSGSRSILGSRKAKPKPGAPISPPSTCGSMPTTPRKDLLVLKIGGSVGAEDDAALDAVVALNDAGHPL